MDLLYRRAGIRDLDMLTETRIWMKQLICQRSGRNPTIIMRGP